MDMAAAENWMRQGIFLARHFRGHSGMTVVENSMAGDCSL
jgi:hypothetical protein